MGLDMFAFTMEAQPTSDVDFTVNANRELHYWRKHPDLHGWMHRLYREKGGSDDGFNCVPLRLTVDDIDRLAEVIRARTLPQTSGFFFGESDGTELEDDLQFVAKAREALAVGLTVCYSAWW